VKATWSAKILGIPNSSSIAACETCDKQTGKDGSSLRYGAVLKQANRDSDDSGPEIKRQRRQLSRAPGGGSRDE